MTTRVCSSLAALLVIASAASAPARRRRPGRPARASPRESILGRDTMVSGLRPSRITAGGSPSEARVCTSPSSAPTWRSTLASPLHASRWTRRRDAPPPPSSVVITSLPWFSASTGRSPVPFDVDVEEVAVGVPGLHPLEHRPPLRGVGDDVHVRARDEPGAPPAGVHVDHHVGEREEDARQEVGELLVRRPVRPAGERAVEVRAGRPVARVRLGGGGREDRHDDHAAVHHLGLPAPAAAASPPPDPRTRRRGCRRGRARSAPRRGRSRRSGRRCSPSRRCS